MKSEKAEQIRVKYLYRSLILKRQVSVPTKSAVKIVGPDCAYHLYSQFKAK